jgi:hypothetical protein
MLADVRDVARRLTAAAAVERSVTPGETVDDRGSFARVGVKEFEASEAPSAMYEARSSAHLPPPTWITLV